MPDVAVDVTVNGVSRRERVPARTLLVHFLRDNLRLTGTHVGCDTTQCGACTVTLDGVAVKSCTVLAAQASGHEVTTIEGLAPDLAEITARGGTLAAGDSRPAGRESPASPEAASPEPASPEPASPEAASPEPASPEAASPEPASPEAASPEPASPEAASPEAASPEPASPEPASHEAAPLEAVPPEPAPPAPAQPEAVPLHPVQRAFWRHHGLQCGYCTPGMVMMVRQLLADNPDPTDAEVRHALAGNICRCTGYQNIVAAALDAATELRGR